MKWKANLSQFIDDLKGIPSVIECNEISDTAKEDELESIEKKIEITLPPKFRKFLLESAAGFDISWSLDDDALVELTNEKECIDTGKFSFHINNILSENPQFRDDYKPDDYDTEYRPEDLLAFMSTPNGDQFSVTLTGSDIDSIKYLSHDIDDIHLYKAGSDIESFFENYARIGFAGPEYWIWEQFTNNRTTPIDCKSPNAAEFIDAIRSGRRSLEAEAANRRSVDILHRMQYEKYVVPEAERLIQMKNTDAFLTLLSKYTDLMSGSIKKRYEYYLKKKNG